MDIHGGYGTGKFRIRHQKRRLPVLQDVVHLPVHQGVVNGDNHGPQADHRQMYINKLRPVGRVQSHFHAPSDAHLIQLIPIQGNQIPQFPVGYPFIALNGHMV